MYFLQGVLKENLIISYVAGLALLLKPELEQVPSTIGQC